MRKKARDLEKAYSKKEFVRKLRRLADAIDGDKSFSIQVAKERITVPSGAIINIEHERDKEGEELEFQIKWSKKKRS